MSGFTFHQEWPLPVSPARLTATLAEVGRYPCWWPQVRSVRRVNDGAAQVAVRSVLPFTLHVVIAAEVEDLPHGVLRVRIEGDLSGWAEWRVHGTAEGAVAAYRQQVVVTRPALAVLAQLVAPALRANHRWMMRRGRRALRSEILTGPSGTTEEG